MASRIDVIEDILTNPCSSYLYMNHRYYYAIGNTKSVDLTEGCEIPSQVQFLLLGCGDIRNILQTVHEIGQSKTVPESLTFHLNDIDDVLLARNAVLLQIVHTIDPDMIDDIQFLWNIWYNLRLSEHDYLRLKSVLTDIVENPLSFLKFAAQECSSAVKRVIKYWLKLNMRVRDAQLKREAFIIKKVAADLHKKERHVKMTDAVETLLCNSSGFLIGCLYRSKQEEYFEEMKTYFRTGSTDNRDDPGYTNPIFLCPHVDGWRVHPTSLPYSAFNDLTFDDKLSMTENCILQLQSQLKSWHTYARNGGILNIFLWDGDAFTLCNRRLPYDMKFHFMNTSNLADHTSLLNILLTCSKRLERFLIQIHILDDKQCRSCKGLAYVASAGLGLGVLTVQTMKLLDKEHGCIEKYLEVEVGIPSSFYPTFLGLNLAEDFDLGTSDIPQHRLNSGLNEVTIRWISADQSPSSIDIEESPEIVQVFERLAKSCFNMLDAKNPNPLNTPLTLVYLIKQLSSKLDGGVTALLKMAERCLPTEVTRFREPFRPLEMEWRVLTLYHFRQDLPGKINETLVEVRVPIMQKQINVACAVKNIPASLGICHRALVASHCLEVLSILQGQYSNPWSVLTVMDYDYKTCMMTCVVPKSDAMIFSPDIFFVPVLRGSLSHMAPSGPWTAFVLAGLDVSTGKRVIKSRKELPEHLDIKLTLSETKTDYKLGVHPKDQSITIQSLEVGAQEKTITTKIELRKNEQDQETVVLQSNVPCPVASLTLKIYKKERNFRFAKSKALAQGQLILPSRCIDVSSYPRLSTKDIGQFGFIVMYMFSPSAEDRKLKEQGIESTETLYQLKETLQILLNWAINPPKEKPFVRAYRIMRKQRSRLEGFGYFPEDVFIIVQNLHSVRGIPTLDIVWIDFEKYRELVPYDDDKDSEDAEKQLYKNEGGILEREDTIHSFLVSIQEANLLKKLLRINSSRSVQKLEKNSSSAWAFNSYLQPVFSIKPEFDLIKHKSDEGPGHSSRQVLSEISQNPQNTKCGFCGRSRPDMKKCSKCKSVMYCNQSCQQKDWKARHKKKCQPLA